MSTLNVKKVINVCNVYVYKVQFTSKANIECNSYSCLKNIDLFLFQTRETTKQKISVIPSLFCKLLCLEFRSFPLNLNFFSNNSYLVVMSLYFKKQRTL